MNKKIAIAGIVGVPGRYGGFETLAENLVRYHDRQASDDELTVFCSAVASPDRADRYLGARLDYVNLDANGAQSIPYDMACLWRCIRQKQDHVVLLGVSGAIMLPFVRAVSNINIITNIDGIEWKRAKWSGLARWILRKSEKIAVRWSHVVVADNDAIAEHVRETYGTGCEVIAYGGDHAVEDVPGAHLDIDLPEAFALALCRIEPENNVEMILEAWAGMTPEQRRLPLVFVGNWNKSDYGRAMRRRFAACEGIHIVDPIYDPGALLALRRRARAYIHGHSAGGTNPSLVEMMHFGIPVLAHGCNFNRYTTEEKARYFLSAPELRDRLATLPDDEAFRIGADMQEIARRRYTWDRIGEAYFKLLTQRG